MEKINATTLAAAKMLQAATAMMRENAGNLNEFENEILNALLDAGVKVNKAITLWERQDAPCTRTEKIYTDGACSGNPGPGGWGLVRIADGDDDNKILKQSHGYRRTTNNRMELMAAIAALELFRVSKTEIEIVSDSKYLTDAINKGWLDSWAKDGFEKPANADLWQYLHRMLKKVRHEGHTVTFTWVKGHAGHKWNEMADDLAVSAANQQKDKLSIDEEYEK